MIPRWSEVGKEGTVDAERTMEGALQQAQSMHRVRRVGEVIRDDKEALLMKLNKRRSEGEEGGNNRSLLKSPRRRHGKEALEQMSDKESTKTRVCSVEREGGR